jgi:hypothetical protein
MATSNQSDEKFCSLCDPSPIKAMNWCSECDDFLCSDCLKHHKSSKSSTNHSTMSLEDYRELPTVVQTLNYHCEDHDEKLDLFCPVHNRPCCIRCVLTSHTTCAGVAPLKDFVPNFKSAPAMLDLEQTLKELGSFVKRLTDDKEENIKEILTLKKEMCEEIHKIRKSLNNHLDQLQQTLIGSINRTVDDITLQLGDVKNSLIEIENKTSDIALEFIKIKEHASDLQTFLSLPHFISKVHDEEKNVEKLGSEDKLNRKIIIFSARIDDIIKMNSIGDVGVEDIKSDVAYVKEKEKQAQIVGPLTTRTNARINLKLLKEIDVKVENPSSIIIGCTILDNGKVLFCEFNSTEFIDRVTLNDSNGNFIRTVQGLSPHDVSFFDITSIDTNTIAVSTGTCISIVNIDPQSILHKIENTNDCYGITHCDGKLYYCHEKEGIRQFDMKTNTNELLVSTDIGKFSHISRDGNKLLYISDTETVSCYDMNGKHMWSFNDTSLLHKPRGIVVDSDGFVFVAGKQTGNIVVISPDGNSAKEVYQISVPRAMWYDKNENKILLCHTDRKASWFQISVDA